MKNYYVLLVYNITNENVTLKVDVFLRDLMKNDPFLLISRIRASHWKTTPFVAKMGTSMVYALVGSGGAQFPVTEYLPARHN